MDRIKRLSMEILDENKDRFGTDFLENKKILDEISIVRSKGLKNELAGFITKFIKREIRDQAEKLRKEKESLKELEKYCISGRFVSQVAFAVVVLSNPGSKWHEIDTTRAVQNMVLTAWSCNLGSCWIGNIDSRGLRNFLQIPDKWNVLTVLPFGYFNEKIITTNKFRKAPVDVFHLNVYGNKLID